MYQNINLQNYLEQSSTISLQSLITAEWNMNFADNISLLGNYRNRPSATLTGFSATLTAGQTTVTVASTSLLMVGQALSKTSGAGAFGANAVITSINSTTQFSVSVAHATSGAITFSVSSVASKYLPETLSILNPGWYGATDSDIVTSTGLNSTTLNPTIFISKNKKESLLYSLTDTVGRFRPRSGINKLRFFKGSGLYLNTANENMFLQPRFYLSSKDDKFKYWNSYRVEAENYNPANSTENRGIERGIATKLKSTGEYYIDDASPFVKYSNPVPANRLVVKMQTLASDFQNPAYKLSNNSSFVDPFYENPNFTSTLINQETPVTWKIQYLDANNIWQTAKSFDSTSLRSTGKRIIGADGYVELAYGITNTLPTNFTPIGEIVNSALLPTTGNLGDAYLVPDSTLATSGTYYYWNGSAWASFAPTYGWYVNEEGQTTSTSNVTALTSPESFGTSTITYREFQYIYGIRIVVDTMSQPNAMFNLIEMSPRLTADLSDKVMDYSITKSASDIGNTGIPVGQLTAATGTVNIFDYDQSFNEYNTASILNISSGGNVVYNISSKNLQFKFYEQIIDNRTSGSSISYFVPIKTMYVDGFPKISNQTRQATLDLRDFFFYFESMTAPSILMRNVKLSKAIATLLDNIGFSNYKFYRNANETDDVIPYFYVAPDTTVADVLNDLAQSTQTAMFFDETNNFITMSRNYLMPSSTDRDTDITLYGTIDYGQSGITKNAQTNLNSPLTNIISIDSEDNEVFNGGKITYSNKYIQKSYGTVQEASLLNNAQSYKYKPVLLWEVSGTEDLRPTNEEIGNQSSYVLSALTLNSALTNELPYIDSSGIIRNNIIDFGQSIYWLTRYEGYTYANGEIIKYKGVEHTISSSAITGLQAKIVSGSSTITLTSGNIYSLSIGQQLTKTSGTGTFASSCVITKIDKVKNMITVSNPHTSNTSAGDYITFTANSVNNNVWIDNVNDYEKYFAQVPFGGKIFPTGRVKIYAEPYYASDGTVDKTRAYQDVVVGNLVSFVGATTTSTNNTQTTDRGAVAKHGRMQFGTGVYSPLLKTLMPTTHTILDSSNEWLDSTKAKAFSMDSKWMFKNDHSYSQTKYIFTSVTGASGQKTITLTTGTTGTMEVGWIVTGTGIPTGSGDIKVVSIATDNKSFTISKNLTASVAGGSIAVVDRVINTLSRSAAIPFLSKVPVVQSTVKNMFDSGTFTESSSTKTQNKKKSNGSTQSSALIINGVSNSTGNSNDYVSYVYKNHSTVPNANVFGTRMRIVGKEKQKGDIASINQLPLGADVIDTIVNGTSSTTISGTGGGIAINLNSPTANANVGYYFEILALTNDTVMDQVDSANSTIDTIPNVYFYKVMKDTVSPNHAIPVVLWYGSAPILVDDGLFSGMGKIVGEANSTVYDLSIKTEQVGSNTRIFYLYLNNNFIATVEDTDAIPLLDTNNQNIALFVRGGGRCMFEHVYAIQDNKQVNTTIANGPISSSLGSKEQTFNSSVYRKYLINPTVIDSFMDGINTNGQPKNNIYYEEFGTIMRECAYFNIRYDKAYPALYSKISPTFNDRQGYLVSGFRSNPYGAEFMIFNVTDFALSLDETTGNYLRIQGITFTQQSSHDLTVDDYLAQKSSLHNYNNYSSLNSKYVNIENSRNNYGRHDFTINGTYIQNQDMANNLMKWMVDKVMVPKKSVGVSIFANPMIQLGDIVTINYSSDNVQQLPSSRFVVYHIEYQRNSDGPSMNLYLSEVV